MVQCLNTYIVIDTVKIRSSSIPQGPSCCPFIADINVFKMFSLVVSINVILNNVCACISFNNFSEIVLIAKSLLVYIDYWYRITLTNILLCLFDVRWYPLTPCWEKWGNHLPSTSPFFSFPTHCIFWLLSAAPYFFIV